MRRSKSCNLMPTQVMGTPPGLAMRRSSLENRKLSLGDGFHCPSWNGSCYCRNPDPLCKRSYRLYYLWSFTKIFLALNCSTCLEHMGIPNTLIENAKLFILFDYQFGVNQDHEFSQLKVYSDLGRVCCFCFCTHKPSVHSLRLWLLLPTEATYHCTICDNIAMSDRFQNAI